MSVSLQISTAGTGKNLVFLHGWGVNSGVWEPLITYLKEDFCITTIDLPGYGLNHKNQPTPYNIESVAKSVSNYLPADCILIGWSLGGLIAQQVALDYPAKLKQLILICSSPKFSKNHNWPGIEPKVLDYFIQQLSVESVKTLDRFLAIQAMGSDTARQDVKTIRKAVQQYPPASEQALLEGLDMLENIDLRNKIKNLVTPCMMFLGRLDTLVPEKVAPCIQQLNPHIEIETLHKASHAPFISDTKGFSEQLRKALIF